MAHIRQSRPDIRQPRPLKARYKTVKVRYKTVKPAYKTVKAARQRQVKWTEERTRTHARGGALRKLLEYGTHKTVKARL